MLVQPALTLSQSGKNSPPKTVNSRVGPNNK